jgi:hypothetical protein
MEHPQLVTARPRPSDLPREAWVLGAATVVALIAGTVVRGFIGDGWIFTTHNLGESVRSALPLLVATAVMVGVGRWTAGRAWLLAGAWLLAVVSVLSVLFDVQFAQIVNQGGGFEALEPWLVIGGVAGGVSHVLGFGALATGIWRSRGEGWPGIRAAAAVALAVVTALAAAGPLVAIGSFGAYGSVPSTIVNLTLTTAATIAAGALAVAAVRGGPARGSIPELVIAAGTALYVAVEGLSWWLFVTRPIEPGLIGSLEPLANVALLLVGMGFASGAVFGPVDD